MRTLHRLGAAALGTVLLAGSTAGLTMTPAAAAKAPGKVTKVQATSDKGKYRLTWKKPKGKVTAYEVADRTKRKRGWTSWKTVEVKKRAATVKGRNGSVHQARVRALGAKGTGAWSKKVKIRVGLPDQVAGVSVTGGKKQATVAWSPASGNGAKVTGYVVRTKTTGSWTTTKAAATATSVVIGALGEDAKVQAQVRAKNKRGLGPWSSAASGTTHPKPAPKLTIAEPGPYQGGDVVTASVTGFPHDVSTINIAVCANDGRPLSGPDDCATLMGPSNQIVSVTKGAGSTKLTVPDGALGNVAGAPITCDDGDEKCAFVAATIGGDFHFAGPIAIEYVDPTLTVSDEGPFAGGETVTASFSGFPGDVQQINVAVCRWDQAPGGPQDCATLMGPSNKIVDSVNGKGSAQLVIPTEIMVTAPDPADPPVELDCTVSGNCAIVAATMGGDFFLDWFVLEYVA